MDFSQHSKHQKQNIIRGWLLLVIVLCINLLSLHHFFRLDLTAEGKYTLGKSSQEIAQSADDIINIKFYVSAKLPPNLYSSSQYIEDILDEFKASSNGNIEYTVVDPEQDANLIEETTKIGVPRIQMEILEKDKYQVQNGYFGLGIFYAGKSEVIPIVQNLSTLEYDLSSRLKKLLATDLPKIGFLSGINGYDSQNGYSTLAQILSENYQVVDINLSENTNIDVNTIIVGGPRSALGQKTLFILDQFILQGGKVIFLVDTLDINPGLSVSAIDQSVLDNFLRQFGISLNADLIYDSYHENASFSQGFISYILPYPLWPKFIKQNFDQENAIVSTLKSVSIPWVSSLTLQDKDGLELRSLVQSSEKSDHQTENYNLDPQQEFLLQNPQKFTVATLVEGDVKSYFSGDNLTSLGDLANNFVKQSTKPIQIIVVGDSDFVSDQFIKQFPDNQNFILNAVDYLTLDADLIALRSKSVNENTLKEITDRQKTMAKNLGIFLSPFLLIAYGLLRLKKRRQLKNAL